MNNETRKEIEYIVDKKIREHEVRVGVISGVIGTIFILGIIHSIWLIKGWLAVSI